MDIPGEAELVELENFIVHGEDLVDFSSTNTPINNEKNYHIQRDIYHIYQEWEDYFRIRIC